MRCLGHLAVVILIEAMPPNAKFTRGARGEISALAKLILSQPPLPIGLLAREWHRL